MLMIAVFMLRICAAISGVLSPSGRPRCMAGMLYAASAAETTGNAALSSKCHQLAVQADNCCLVAQTLFLQTRLLAAACPKGFYMKDGTICTPCATGWVSTTVNAATCSLCASGERASQDQSMCGEQ
jgi:hypothetical protein